MFKYLKPNPQSDGNLAILLRSYPGDEAWNAFVQAGVEQFGAPTVNPALLEVVRDEGLAVALTLLIGEHVPDWLESKVPALDGETPCRVLAMPGGRTILRALVMRFP